MDSCNKYNVTKPEIQFKLRSQRLLKNTNFKYDLVARKYFNCLEVNK
jgi:hypothetical protein